MALDGSKLSVETSIPWTAGGGVRQNLFIQVSWVDIVAQTQARSLKTNINIYLTELSSDNEY